jgi:hypothetical protein
VVDANIKKVIYPASKLPILSLIGEDELVYPIRYRIVSQDGTETSAWSPIYEVPIRSFPQLDVNISVSSTGTLASIVWDNPANKIGVDVDNNPIRGINTNFFDIYVKWKDASNAYLTGFSDYVHAGTTASQPTYNLFTLRVPATAKHLDVLIQVATNPHKEVATAKVWAATNFSV